MLISEVAAATGLHRNTIYRLERKGLIAPTRTWTGARVYTANDVAHICKLYGRESKPIPTDPPEEAIPRVNNERSTGE